MCKLLELRSFTNTNITCQNLIFHLIIIESMKKMLLWFASVWVLTGIFWIFGLKHEIQSKKNMNAEIPCWVQLRAKQQNSYACRVQRTENIRK